MVWVGRDLIEHLVPTPCHGQGHFRQTRLLKDPSNMALNTSSDVTLTASLGNLVQCLTTLVVKNFFLLSNVKLPSYRLSYHYVHL